MIFSPSRYAILTAYSHKNIRNINEKSLLMVQIQFSQLLGAKNNLLNVLFLYLKKNEA